MSNKNNRKLRHISLRVTQPERDGLSERAAGRTLSDYIREQVLGTRSRSPLQLTEKETLNRLARIGDALSDYVQHIGTHSTLKRGDVMAFLRKVENDLSTVRLLILKGEANVGDC